MKNFINEEEINSLLEDTQKSNGKDVLQILENARDINHKKLSLKEMAILLQNTDEELEKEIENVAREIKERVYGNRMVLFAPLYVSNVCKNSCLYCGFRQDNKELKRRILTNNEIKEEVKIIEEMGHKRLLMVWGESEYDMELIVEQISAAYSVKTGKSGEIRRINVNLAPMDVDDFRKLKSGNIGTYQCFQETYHKPTYEKVHVFGKKTDYLYRLYAMHRAMEAGIDDVGIGALYGLYDYKFETLAVLKHVEQLEKDMGVGPHTISFPRIEPALGSEMSYNPPAQLTDKQLKRTIAIMRIAVPYTGLIISTRENAAMRNELISLGISQLSAASKVYPGGYKMSKTNLEEAQQFTVGDDRSLDEVIFALVQDGYVPSFCTGCYRKDRTGDNFMGLAKNNFIKNFCLPNAIFTFAEYLRDYASEKTQVAGDELVKKLIAQTKNPSEIEKKIDSIKCGANDIYV